MSDDIFNTTVLFPLLLLIGQTLVSIGQRKINQRMDEGERKRDKEKVDTDAKRAAEAEWRKGIELRMAQFESSLLTQDGKIDAILRGQLTQMRSDIVHKAHRYIDDLGCASIDEKNSFDAEFRDYGNLCKTYEIENDFVDCLHEQVMALPGRTIDTTQGVRYHEHHE